MGSSLGGGKGKSKAPKAPDYTAVAKEQGAQDRATAAELTAANRPTQIDAFGNTLSWTKDDAGNWTQRQTLNPHFAWGQLAAGSAYSQAADEVNKQGSFKAPGDVTLANSGNQAMADALRRASSGDFVNNAGTIGDFDRTQGDKVAADMYEAVMGRARPEQQRQQEALDVKLRQQGLEPGTEAYNRAMQNMLTAHGDVATQAGLNATTAGYNAARDIYTTNLAGQNQRFNQAADTYGINQAQDWNAFQGATAIDNQEMARNDQALREQAQRYSQALTNYQTPMQKASAAASLFNSAPGASWEGFSGATGYNPADLTGAAQSQYQAAMGGYNASQNKKNNLLSTGGTLGAAGIMASDEELKDNIRPLVGKDALIAVLELGGYEYDWKDGTGHDMGVIAQQVQKVLPNLVMKAEKGHLVVSYAGLVALLIEAIKYLASSQNEAD